MYLQNNRSVFSHPVMNSAVGAVCCEWLNSGTKEAAGVAGQALRHLVGFVWRCVDRRTASSAEKAGNSMADKADDGLLVLPEYSQEMGSKQVRCLVFKWTQFTPPGHKLCNWIGRTLFWSMYDTLCLLSYSQDLVTGHYTELPNTVSTHTELL